MQNINQTDYKNRLAHAKSLKNLPDNIEVLCKDNNLLVLDCILDLLLKQDSFVLNLSEPIILNICTKLKKKICDFLIKQFNINKNSTIEILISYFTNKNSKLLCSILNLLIEIAENYAEELLLNNLSVLFEHPDSEVKKNSVRLAGVLSKHCDIFTYIKDIKSILLKDVQSEIKKYQVKKEKGTNISKGTSTVGFTDLKQQPKISSSSSENTTKKEGTVEKKETELPKEIVSKNTFGIFQDKYPFFSDKKWNIRLEELKNNINNIKKEDPTILAQFLASSSETITQICLIFIDLLPNTHSNEMFLFFSKRITDSKLHLPMKEKITKNDAIIDLLYEFAKQKKGKIFSSTLKFFNVLIPDRLDVDKFEEYLDSCTVSSLIEKQAIKESKKIIEEYKNSLNFSQKFDKPIENFVQEAKNMFIEEEHKIIHEEFVEEGNKSGHNEENISVVECEQSLSILNINESFAFYEGRIKDGQNIEKYLNNEEIKFLKESDLTKIQTKIIKEYSDFILQVIQERKIPIHFYLTALRKEKYVLSEYEVKMVISILTERNDFEGLVKLYNLYPVSKLMVLLQENIVLYAKILIIWIKRYRFYNGDVHNIYSILNSMNDHEGMTILCDVFPNILSITPRKKKVQFDKLSSNDFVEASFVEEVLFDEKEINPKWNDVSFSFLSDKSMEEIKLLEEEFYSNENDITQANSILTELMQSVDNFDRIVELTNKEKFVKNLCSNTLISLHHKIIKEIKKRKKQCSEILFNILKHSKINILIFVYLTLSSEYSPLILKLLNKLNDRINYIEKHTLLVIKEFYENKPTFCFDYPQLHIIVREIMNKCIDKDVDGLIGNYIRNNK